MRDISLSKQTVHDMATIAFSSWSFLQIATGLFVRSLKKTPTRNPNEWPDCRGLTPDGLPSSLRQKVPLQPGLQNIQETDRSRAIKRDKDRHHQGRSNTWMKHAYVQNLMEKDAEKLAGIEHWTWRTLRHVQRAYPWHEYLEQHEPSLPGVTGGFTTRKNNQSGRFWSELLPGLAFHRNEVLDIISTSAMHFTCPAAQLQSVASNLTQKPEKVASNLLTNNSCQLPASTNSELAKPCWQVQDLCLYKTGGKWLRKVPPRCMEVLHYPCPCRHPVFSKSRRTSVARNCELRVKPV